MKPPVTIDFETYYSKTVGFSKLTTEQYIRHPEFHIIGVGIKEGDSPAAWHSFSHKLQYQALLAPYMDRPVIAHNAIFDAGILSLYLGLKPSMIIDTLSMARPHHGSVVGGSLKSLAEHYQLGVKGTEVEDALGLRLSDFSPAQLQQYGEYCKNDCDLTWELFKKLYPRTSKQEMRLIDQTIRLFTEPVLELDTKVLSDHLAKVVQRKQELLATIPYGQDELMSNPKFAELLISLGVEPPTKISLRTKKSTYAFGKTDKEFTALLEHEDERVQTVVAARLGAKSTIEETRTQAFIDIASRGPLPIPLAYAGASTTWRWSGQDKINLQNLPRGGALRNAIKAPVGYKIVSCDSSNIELRINHTLAGQAETVEALREGRDLYCEFASVIFGRPITKADVMERMLGKICHLGLGYGMGAAKFAETVRIQSKGKILLEPDEAERIVRLWRSTYDAIPRAWKQADKMLQAIASETRLELGGGLVATTDDGLITAPEHRIYYPNLRKEEEGWVYDSKKFKTIVPVHVYGGKVIENVCQHLARNIIAEQWLKISEKYRVVLQVHDEIVAVVPEAEAEACKAYMLETMSTAPTWWPEIPLAAEAGIGDSYGDAH